MLKLILLITVGLISCPNLYAQAPFSTNQNSEPKKSQILLTKADIDLENAIYKASLKHALYSYNIANATTPGFKPILFPEDELELSQMVLNNEDHFEKVVLEHMTASMGRNKNLHSGYLALYKKRFEIYKTVVTAGKK
jgi:hypothetical protein